MPKKISDLPIGAKVKIGTYNGQPIVWLLADKGNQFYSGLATFITEKNVAVYLFDAPEPSSNVSNHRSYGNPSFEYSNIFQWLNGVGTSWYKKVHSYDAAPSYANAKGFMTDFASDVRNVLSRSATSFATIDSNKPTTSTYPYGAIGLPSATEIGLSTVYEGATFQLMRTTSYRISNGVYYLRTFSGNQVRQVNAQGGLINAWPSNPNGIRPICNIKLATQVSDNVDGSGCYTLYFPVAPGVPASISVPGSVNVGKAFTVSWGASSGKFETYILERKDGSGQFIRVTSTTSAVRSYTDTIHYNVGTVQYRVMAQHVDSNANPTTYTSDYRTSGNCTVIANRAPTNPGAISVSTPILSGKNQTVSWGASTDPDGNLKGYFLEYNRNQSGWSVLRELTATQTSHTYQLQSGGGTVQYRVRAVDTLNLYSGYTTSSLYTVINNQPPTISGQDYNFGALTSVFTPYSYTINDPDSPTLTVKETMDGAQRRTFTAAPGSTHVIQFTTDQWFALANGSHTITITVTDQYNETATRNIFFSKNVITADSMDLPVIAGQTYMLQLRADRVAQNPNTPILLRYPSNMLQFVEFETSKPGTADTTMPYPNGYYQLEGHDDGLVRLKCTRAAVANWSGHIVTACFKAKSTGTAKVELY